jgi:hypothetical protein
MRKTLKVILGCLAILSLMTMVPLLIDSPSDEQGPYLSALSEAGIGQIEAGGCPNLGCPADPFCNPHVGTDCAIVGGNCFRVPC